ncbi:replication initiation regulator SeqA [Thalassotalea sp. 42_200_T64]|nr:replication initiation regulator SeqA [Thalassotalea sp. 42_200_T64]
MNTIDIDDELYQYIARNTKFIGESASDILRRLLNFDEINAQSPAVELKTAEEQKPKKESNKPSNSVTDVVDLVELNVKKPVKVKVIESTHVEGSQNIFDLINKEELATQRGAVGRFLLILANLHRVHPQQFDAVIDIRGRDRLYFASSESALLENGSSTKPKQIPDAKFWVITNSNTTKKKLMLTDVAHVLGYSSSDAEKIRDLL